MIYARSRMLLSQKKIRKIAYIKNGDVVSEYKQIQVKGSKDGDLGYLGRVHDLFKHLHLIIISFSVKEVQFKDRSTQIYIFNNKKKSGESGKILSECKKFLNSCYLLIKKKPDLIICGTVDLSLWGACFSSLILRKPIILSVHGALILNDTIANKVRLIIQQKIIQHCDAVLCNGPYMKDEMIKSGVDPLKTILFLPTFNELVINSQKKRSILDKYILYVGRIEEKKGVYDLLKAYKRIEQKTDTTMVKLIYAGDGSLLNGLVREARKTHLKDKVIFLGKVHYENLGELILQSLFVVVPSRSTMCEGICKVALEAQILGKPLIAPNYGVFPYIINNHSNGLLFKPDSISDLYEKMYSLLTNEDLYRSLKKGAFTARQRFTIPDTTFSDAIVSSLEFI